jgi:hypothetical protein
MLARRDWLPAAVRAVGIKRELMDGRQRWQREAD